MPDEAAEKDSHGAFLSFPSGVAMPDEAAEKDSHGAFFVLYVRVTQRAGLARHVLWRLCRYAHVRQRS